MPDTYKTLKRDNQETWHVQAGRQRAAECPGRSEPSARAGEAAGAESGGSREPVTAVLNRLRDVAASHDASGPLAVQPRE